MKEITKKKKIIRAKITKKKFFFFLGGMGTRRQAGRQAGGRSWSCHLSGGFMVKLCVANSTRYLHAASAESLYNNNKKKKIPHAKLLCGAKISVYVFLSN